MSPFGIGVKWGSCVSRVLCAANGRRCARVPTSERLYESPDGAGSVADPAGAVPRLQAAAAVPTARHLFPRQLGPRGRDCLQGSAHERANLIGCVLSLAS